MDNELVYDYLVVGGGILGLATAWTLKKQCPQTAVGLVTAGNLCDGTTSQAAALVTQGRSSECAAGLVQDTLVAIDELDREIELGLPFHRSGGLHLAKSGQEHEALVAIASVADQCGIKTQWLAMDEAKWKAPQFNLEGFRSALWFEGDGYIDPVLLANAYGESARAKGVKIHSGSRVSELLAENGTIHGVKLETDVDISANHVIVCAGPWAANLLKPLGCSLPVAPVRSLYWMTERHEFNPALPVTIVPSAHAYFRKENQSILFGIRDYPGVALHPDNVPDDVQSFAFSEDTDGVNALSGNWDQLVSFWPQIEQLGLAHFISGISTYSLDGLPVIGVPISSKSADYSNKPMTGLTVVTGCSGAGIAYSAGIAKQAVQHALNGHVPDELSFNRFSSETETPVYDIHSRALAANSEALCAYDANFRQRCLRARYNKKAG